MAWFWQWPSPKARIIDIYGVSRCNSGSVVPLDQGKLQLKIIKVLIKAKKVQSLSGMAGYIIIGLMKNRAAWTW